MNIIRWPVVSLGVNYDGSLVGSGQSRAEGMVDSIYHWTPVIAPSGMIFYGGDAFPDSCSPCVPICGKSGPSKEPWEGPRVAVPNIRDGNMPSLPAGFIGRVAVPEGKGHSS